MDALQQPMTPQSQPLRTLSLLEILDRTFRIYRENLITCIGLVAVVTIPISIINFILSTSSLQQITTPNGNLRGSLSANGLNSSGICLSALITIVLAVLEFVLTNGPISYIASESMFGRKVTIGEAFRARQSRYYSLGCGFLLFYFVLGGLAAVITFVYFICAPAALAFGVLIYIGIAVYSVLVPVMTLEEVGASLGVNRAWALGKARFWPAAGLLVAILLITGIISFAFNLVVGLILDSALSSASFVTLQTLTTLFATLINIFLVPLLPIGMTLFYYDTRLRIEGLDIALQALDRPDARPYDLASPLPQRGFTSTNWRDLIIVTVCTIAVVVLAGATLYATISSLVPGGLPTR